MTKEMWNVLICKFKQCNKLHVKMNFNFRNMQHIVQGISGHPGAVPCLALNLNKFARIGFFKKIYFKQENSQWWHQYKKLKRGKSGSRHFCRECNFLKRVVNFWPLCIMYCKMLVLFLFFPLVYNTNLDGKKIVNEHCSPLAPVCYIKPQVGVILCNFE